jgi:O-antigen/teichoic acid export membrane protein
LQSLQQKVLNSSSLLIATKVFQRTVGLISILILARLLTPDDFAIVALTVIIVHFFDMLSNVGSEQYIIQKEKVSSEDINTAWTIDILLKSALWLLLVCLSYFIDQFYPNSQLQLPLIIASVILIINALKNPGVLLLKKNLRYRKIFGLSVIQKLLSFIIVMAVAYTWQSFWALIVGDIIASLVFTIGSYFIHSYRPQLSLKHFSQQWHFSQWLFLKGIVGYIRSQIDTLLVSKFFNSALLGKYYMARNIAMLPGHNLLHPAIEPLLAAFSESRNNLPKLEEHFRFSLFIGAFLSIPITFYIWNFPTPIIETILGDQWVDASKVLGYMSLLFLYYTFVLVIEQALIALQKTKALLYFDLISLVVITSIIWGICTQGALLIDVAFYRGVLGLLLTVCALLFLSNLIKLKLARVCLLTMPIILFSWLSIAITQQLELTLFALPLFNLIASCSSFVCCYILLCWLCALIFKQNSEIKQATSLLKNIIKSS